MTVGVRRPQRSAKRNAGMVTRNIRRAEMPEARKEAVEDFRPAEEKRRGAYCLFPISVSFLSQL
jgi:hypothetical protein